MPHDTHRAQGLSLDLQGRTRAHSTHLERLTLTGGVRSHARRRWQSLWSPPTLCTLLTILLAHTCPAAEAQLTPMAVETSYEVWQLPQGERMGMQRLGLRRTLSAQWEGGVEAYSATSGQRGGFITMGASLGAHYPLMDGLEAQADAFVGGGGGRGGSELTGGGLMVRESLGLRHSLGGGAWLGSGLSWVDFPQQGSVHSRQLFASLRMDFDAIVTEPSLNSQRATYLPRGSGAGDYLAIDASSAHEMLLVWRTLRVAQGTPTDTATPQQGMGLIGVRWKTYLDPHWYADVDTDAADRGASRGYMQVLAGLGYRLGSSGLSPYVELNTGGGGGGGTATGGGLLWDARVGLQYHVDRYWLVDLSASRLWAPGGELRGTTLGLGLGYQLGPVSGESTTPGLELFDRHAIRLRLAEQSYSQASPGWRSTPGQRVDNLGAQLDYFITPSWYLSGQGLSAVRGGAGAYSTGQVGAGSRLGLGPNAFCEAELLVGAAGGGGLNTGGGLMRQVNINLGLTLSKSLELITTLGDAKSLGGEFHAHVVGLSLGYKSDLLTLH